MNISEENFKTVLDALWLTFTKSAGMLKALNSIGLDPCDVSVPSPDTTYIPTGLGELYGIMGVTPKAVMTLAEVMPDAMNASCTATILEELDRFFADTQVSYPDRDTFPAEEYHKLIKILKSGTTSLPWEDPAKRKNKLIYNAYWGGAALGLGNDLITVSELFNCGFDRYTLDVRDTTKASDQVKVTVTKHITIWAHNVEEAKRIVDQMPKEDLYEFMY